MQLEMELRSFLSADSTLPLMVLTLHRTPREEIDFLQLQKHNQMKPYPLLTIDTCGTTIYISSFEFSIFLPIG